MRPQDSNQIQISGNVLYAPKWVITDNRLLHVRASGLPFRTVCGISAEFAGDAGDNPPGKACVGCVAVN